MGQYFFNKYTALSIGAQFITCLSIWIVAFAISPSGDRLFGLMFYFYLPAIFLVSAVLGSKGESGMIAAGMYGIAVGILLYGIVFGFVMSFLKRRL
ncbi:MAG TPA: hypothetical protein VIW67_00440 [Terriglobales bacterium]